MLTADTPFVLLDDARPAGAPARLYRAPRRIVEARAAGEVAAALERLRAVGREGLHAAGFLGYAAAPGIEPRLAAFAGGPLPLVWFGLFERYEEVPADAVPTLLPDPAGAWAAAPEPLIGRADYAERFARVQELIAAGDIYQANLTFPAAVRFAGDPLALYARLRERARAPYGAVVWTGRDWLLSFSPELFFRLDGDRLLARPMKGTATRGATAEEDRRTAAGLADDAKQRAENLMIVDLLRNDLARVAMPGSVAVPDLFRVETYPTVHQMVSDIAARLAEGRDAIDVLTALFPCGSVTGAPKVRASEVIAEIEATPRSVYTGAIGRFDAGGDAAFNVAIRTIEISGDGPARIGLGSGVVVDSDAASEWAECLAKGAFVAAGGRRFDLIETMAFDPDAGIALLDRHLARMKASAEVFDIPFDRHAARNELQAATFRLRGARRVRLALAPSGAIAIEVGPMPPVPAGPVAVAVLPRQVAPRDFRLAHKTSDRPYRGARPAGCFEALFVDGDGCLTEGSFTNLFVDRGDGVLVTPPLARGLLPGVLRAELIETGRAVEGDLTAADLTRGFFIGNALRGLIPAVAVAKNTGL